jgi:hypothetical protein
MVLGDTIAETIVYKPVESRLNWRCGTKRVAGCQLTRRPVPAAGARLPNLHCRSAPMAPWRRRRAAGHHLPPPLPPNHRSPATPRNAVHRLPDGERSLVVERSTSWRRRRRWRPSGGRWRDGEIDEVPSKSTAESR